MADRNALMAGYQSRGGVLDTLGLPPVQPAQSPSLMQYLTDYAGRGLGVVDHWAMGIPSTMAGLVNSAIPGQPLGDLWSAKSAAEDARSAVAQSGYADLLALPEAFGGAMPGAVPMAPAAARMAPPAARQAGRLAESAIDPVYNALPDNSVGMFAGKMAKTADTAALARAEDMAAKGMPREQIWNDTGWFQGKDGKWRFEIDDSGLNVKNGLSHPDLMNAYPGLSDTKFNLRRLMPWQSGFSSFMPEVVQGYGTPHANRLGPAKIDIESSLPWRDRPITAHELQHGVQSQEAFASGANAYTAGSWDAYRKTAGEVEARAVEKRVNMTADERRSRPPWEDYDVHESEQIVRFGGSGPQMSMGDGSAGGKLTPPQEIPFGSRPLVERRPALMGGEAIEYFPSGQRDYRNVLLARETPDALHLGGVDLQPANRGQGHAVAMHQALIDDAFAKGKTVYSDKRISADLVNVYEALRRRGYDVRLNPNAEEIVDPVRGRSLQGADPVYTVGGKLTPPGAGPAGITAYHGSPNKFDAFDAEDVNWFALDEETARAFGKDRMGLWPPGSSYYNATSWREAKPNMYEVRIDDNRLMTVDPTEEAKKIAKQIGVDEPKEWRDAGELLQWGDAQNDWIADARKNGFGGVLFKNVGDDPAGIGRDQIAVIDKSIISIVKKYGIAAAISAYGMDQVQQAMGETETQNPLMQGY